MSAAVLANVTGVIVGGRGLLIAGPPGAGKSALALALIDRGATLVGDDAVSIAREGGFLTASPPPNTRGMIEVRNVGIVELPVASGPVALILQLDPKAPRYPLDVALRLIEGMEVPALNFAAGDAVQALRAEYALSLHGLPLPKRNEKA